MSTVRARPGCSAPNAKSHSDGRTRRVPRDACGSGAPNTSPPTGEPRRPGASDAEFVAFQKAWFAELHEAGFAVPHWPPSGAAACRSASRSCSIRNWPPTMRRDSYWRSWGFTTPHPRFWPRAPTHSGNGTYPPSSTARSGCRASPSPRRAPTWPACARRPRRDGDTFVVNGQKLWASGGMHADWCLLLARTDPDALQAQGHLVLLDGHAAPGIDVRPIRNAVGDSHFCEVFLNDVVIPAENLIGAENAGWQVAQATLGRRARNDDAGAGRAPRQCGFRAAGDGVRKTRPDGTRPLDDDVVRDAARGIRDRDQRAARVVPQGGGGPRRVAVWDRRTRRS